MVAFKLAIQYIKNKKEETISILLCIILSVVLIFSLIVIRDSGYDSQIKEAKDLNGEYHLCFENINLYTTNELKNDANVKRLEKVKYLCSGVDKKSGVKVELNSFNKKYIDLLNYKMIGRKPLKNGEVVIEKEAIKQMGLNNPLNKKIELLLINKYLDSDKNNKIISKNESFKIVGLIEKPQKYYSLKSNLIGGAKEQVYVYDGDDYLLEKSNNYKGVIFLKDEKKINKFLSDKQKELNINDDYLHENYDVIAAKSLKNNALYSVDNFKKIIILAIISCIVIYNIFNIILEDIIKDIGILRAIGMSKLEIIFMFINMSIIYIFIGTIIGVTVGIAISYIGVRITYGYNTILTINRESIIYSFMVAIVAVIISILSIIKKANKISIIEEIKNNGIENKDTKLDLYIKSLNFKNSKNIIRNMAIRNIFRNKKRLIITMISIIMISSIFIIDFAIKDQLKKNIEKGITGGVFGMSYGEVDKSISGSMNGSDSLFYKIDEKLIKKISKIEGVKEIEPNFFNLEGYILLNKDKLSADYKKELDRKDEISYQKDTGEYPLLLRGYSDNMLKKREKFIEKGENLSKSKDGKYKKVLLVNNTNSQITHSFKAKVIDNVKIGDVISIKMPIYKNGIKMYKNINVEISGIMKEIYASSQDGNVGVKGAQIIFREDDYRELTGQKKYNKLFIKCENGKMSSVEKELKLITRDYGNTFIGGKGEDLKVVGEYQNSENRLSIIYQILIIFILCINIIFITRSNIIRRKKELSIMKAIGMSIKDLKKLIVLETKIYCIIAALIGIVIAIVNYNIGIFKTNKTLIYGSFEKTIPYGIPFKQIIIILIIFEIIGYLAVYFSRDKIKNIEKFMNKYI